MPCFQVGGDTNKVQLERREEMTASQTDRQGKGQESQRSRDYKQSLTLFIIPSVPISIHF